MKRIIGWILFLVVLFSGTAFAVDNSRSYVFDLAANGKHEINVMPGDVITVVFTLQRTDSAEPYTMYAVQNEIRYDDSFVEILPNGSIVSPEVETRDLGLIDGDRTFYMNYVSFADGIEWNASQLVGTFQVKINGTSGATVLSNENYKVSLRDGSDIYEASSNDLTLIVSSDCLVRFETNGGSGTSDTTVVYGELLPRPADPMRDGYLLEGWYTDIDLTQAWDFDSMTVTSNMTLYAKWSEQPVEPEQDDNLWTKIVDWLKNLFANIDTENWIRYLMIGIPVLAALMLFWLLIFPLRRRKVIFITNGGAPIDPIKVKRGQTLKNLPVPVRGYSMFCGWYKDEKLTDPWYADVDKIKKRKTKLYAKWL